MDGLRVLEALDKLHLELLHLSDLVHFDVAKVILLGTTLVVVLARNHNLAALLLLDLQPGESLRLEPNLVLHPILLFHPEFILPLLGLVLLLDHLRLLGLLLLLEHEGLLHPLFLLVALLLDHIVILGHHPLLLIFQLDVEDFLNINAD